MNERLERLINIIESGIKDKTFSDSDLDLLITSVIMIIENNIRKTQDVSKPKFRK